MTTLPSRTLTPIQGLYRVDLDIRTDHRGWFEEFYQEEKFREIGLGFFRPVQSNASFNLRTGVTRGLHAEPWSKLVTVTSGRVFAAWVDLRPGSALGRIHTAIIEPGVSFFIPRGVANSYQSLEDQSTYVYLVDGLWREGLAYPSLDPFDELLAIPWPVPPQIAECSPKDANNPSFSAHMAQVKSRPVIIFGDGQVGSALWKLFPDASLVNRSVIDLSQANEERILACVPNDAIVINAAAFTAVDAAETSEGRKQAMELNYMLPKRLVRACELTSSTLVHFSSDYVFDGLSITSYSEDEVPNPVSNYGVSKLLGDLAVQSYPQHFILRTSWVFGEGSNFISTMARLCREGRSPHVVEDQFGRPTSASQLAEAVRHLVTEHKDFGTYNFTQSGPIVSWFDLARFVFANLGADPAKVSPCSTNEFELGKNLAPRPRNSSLGLSKIVASGFSPGDWRDELSRYLQESA